MRVEDVFNTTSGTTFESLLEQEDGEYAYVKVGDMNLPGNEVNIMTSSRFVDPDEKMLRALIPDGSIIFPKRGGAIATNKKRVINIPVFVDLNIMAITPIGGVITAYAYRWLSSIDLATLNTGTSVPQINHKDIDPLHFPLPPLPEQQRIVAKIDELMARCDELESLRSQRDEKRRAVHRAAMERLLDRGGCRGTARRAPTGITESHAVSDSMSGTGRGVSSYAPTESSIPTDPWDFLSRHFNDLYAVKENVAELRKAILQLAVMGRLVPQDPNDPPASELLKEIAAEKTRLVKEGKIKPPKPLPPIKAGEVPYELPKGWEWVRLGDISAQITDGAHHTPTYIEEGIPFLSVKNMSSGFLDFSDTRFISLMQHQELIKRCFPQKGDLLLTKVGTTGIPVLVDVDCEFSIFVSVALIKFPQNFISGKFLTWLVKAPLVKKQSEDGTEGVGNKNLVLRKIASFSLPLPPLPEQHRIVAKIDELMARCDVLEAAIDSAEMKQAQLLGAVMAGV